MTQLCLALKELSKQLLKHYISTIQEQKSSTPQIVFNAELSALPSEEDDNSEAKTHTLAFGVPSSIAAQIGEANPQLYCVLCETKDETVVLDAETRVLASAIFAKLVAKKTQLNIAAQ